MTNMFCSFAIALVTASCSISAWSPDSCNFSPAFKQLRGTLSGVSPLAATKALHAFAARPQRPEFCEAAALDDALGEREKLLLALTGTRSGEWPARTVFRRNSFNAKTALRQSPSEDGTAHPNATVMLTPVTVTNTDTFAIKSQLPDGKLYALYLTTLSRASDGKPAKRLPTKSGSKGKLLAPGTVLIAIYEAQGAKKRGLIARWCGAFKRASRQPAGAYQQRSGASAMLR